MCCWSDIPSGFTSWQTHFIALVLSTTKNDDFVVIPLFNFEYYHQVKVICLV